MENEGIIEDVTGEPTPWLNPLVIVPKDEDNIRICVEMRTANKAITRTRYPTPMVDDLLVKLKGSKSFTKLDMASAFHQIELDQDSRFITAFQSDTRIKRFKRLIFGVNLVAEELQHALQTILADTPEAINIANDILIFAEDVKQHDETLTQVLERCDSKGITPNLQKSVICKNNLKYYDFMFSEKVMKPDLEKIQEIREMPASENKKSLEKFSKTNQLHKTIYTRL